MTEVLADRQRQDPPAPDFALSNIREIWYLCGGTCDAPQAGMDACKRENINMLDERHFANISQYEARVGQLISKMDSDPTPSLTICLISPDSFTNSNNAWEKYGLHFVSLKQESSYYSTRTRENGIPNFSLSLLHLWQNISHSLGINYNTSERIYLNPDDSAEDNMYLRPPAVAVQHYPSPVYCKYNARTGSAVYLIVNAKRGLKDYLNYFSFASTEMTLLHPMAIHLAIMYDSIHSTSTEHEQFIISLNAIEKQLLTGSPVASHTELSIAEGYYSKYTQSLHLLSRQMIIEENCTLSLKS